MGGGAAALEAAKPKIDFADAVSASDTSVLVSDLAKLLCQNGIQMGQNRLFAELRNRGFLIRRKGPEYNKPTQRSMERGLFELKETTFRYATGRVSTFLTTMVTGKGQIYFLRLFLNEKLQAGEPICQRGRI